MTIEVSTDVNEIPNIEVNTDSAQNTPQDIETNVFLGPKGVKGDRGPSGVEVSEREPIDSDVKIWLKPDGDSSNILKVKTSGAFIDIPSIKGESATIEVGSVSYGENIEVTNSGTLNNAVLDFVFPETTGKGDEETITKTSNKTLKAIAVMDSNEQGGAIKTWTGTTEEYDSIAEKDLNTLYFTEKAIYKGDDAIGSSGGAGLEIGDIGIAPLGIDETLGKRRYLNGQIIIQEQYQVFTDKVKSAIVLYPNLACSEEDWQATATLSAFGQCGKFVVDDEAGTIRLPKITGFIQGLNDLASLGGLVEAGLPNITATWTPSWGWINGAWCSGAMTTINTNGASGQGGGGGNPWGIDFDASRSSSVYKDGVTTVQPESIRYPYFIQIATGSDVEVDIVNEIELNNPYSLLDVKWSDKLLNNISWLRSEGQANSKAIYNDAYELILREYNSGTDETEAVGGITITFRRGAETNIKVTTDKSAYDSILFTTGTAWYYVIDTANEVFYLPQTDGFLQFGGDGDFVEAGLPNITYSATQWYGGKADAYPTTNGALRFTQEYTLGVSNGGNVQVGTEDFDASRSSSIYGNSDTVQPNAIQGYLYFYVGETVQNANLINAGRIQEQMLTRGNKEEIISWGMPDYENGITLPLTAVGTYDWVLMPCTALVHVEDTVNQDRYIFVSKDKSTILIKDHLCDGGNGTGHSSSSLIVPKGYYVACMAYSASGGTAKYFPLKGG